MDIVPVEVALGRCDLLANAREILDPHSQMNPLPQGRGEPQG